MFLEAAIVLLTMYLFWFVSTTRRQRKNMPPGPFPLPIIGNMHLIGSHPPFSMKPIEDKYGGIYTVTTPMGQIVFVNNGVIGKEGLITKGLDFAGRLGKTFPANHLVEGKGLMFGEYSPALLSLRKIVTSAMHLFGERMKEAEKRICREIDLLLERVEATNGAPFDPKPHLSATTINTIVEWLFSTRYDYHDPTINMLLEFTEEMGRFLRQGNIHQIFPILQNLPTPFMKKLEKWRVQRDGYFKVMFAERRETYDNSIVRDITDALIASYLKEKRTANQEDTVDDCVFLVIDIFTATSDTTKTTLTWLCLYLITFPEVQKKAQEEIDRVIGRDRLPEHKDRTNLPYVEALVAETLRYCTLNPIIPRKATCDTTLCGYSIPKGTDVFFNVWSMHHDPNVWANPNEFNPDRFLDKDGQFLGYSVPSFFPFGGGRRMCLGPPLGKMQVFLVASQLLHQFRFEMVENEPKPSLVGVVSGVLIPESYKLCAIKRS